MTWKLVSDEEMRTLALSIGYARKKKGFTKEEFGVLVKWAEKVRIGDGILANVLKGEFGVLVKWAGKVRIEDGILANVLKGSFIADVVRGEPSFSMSPRGIREVEAMGVPKNRPVRKRKTK